MNLVIHPDLASTNLFKTKSIALPAPSLSNKLLLSTVVILLKNCKAMLAGFNWFLTIWISNWINCFWVRNNSSKSCSSLSRSSYDLIFLFINFPYQSVSNKRGNNFFSHKNENEYDQQVK